MALGTQEFPKKLYFFIDFPPFVYIIDWIKIPSSSTVPHTAILMRPDPPLQPNTHTCSSKTAPHHAPLVLGWNLRTLYQEIWENKPYMAPVFVCLAPIWKVFELLLIKDVQNVLEIFGVWNQDIARNPVRDKQNRMGTSLLGAREKPPPTGQLSCITFHSISSGTFSDPEQCFTTSHLTRRSWGGQDRLSCSDLGVPGQMSFHDSFGWGFVSPLCWVGFHVLWVSAGIYRVLGCPGEDRRKRFCGRGVWEDKSIYLHQAGKHYVNETFIKRAFRFSSLWNQCLRKKFVAGDMKL